jgi:hypothetical protein
VTTRFSPKNAAIAALGAAVIGLGVVVAVDHTAGAPQAQAPAAASSALSVSPALRNVISTAMTAGSAAGGKAGAYGQQIAGLFGLTPDQLKTDIENGQTLDQIAGANDQTIKDEVLSYVSMALDKGVTGGAISSTQESSIKQDLSDLINQLFAAKLGNLKNLKAGG